MKAIELKEELVSKLAESEKIKGIGQTGSIDAVLIPGRSDIDMFILCSEIPSYEERKAWYAELKTGQFSLQMEVCSHCIWGTGDILVAEGIDIMPMYFTVKEMRGYLEEVLQCKHLEKEGRFYPAGRLESVSTIHILYEKEKTWSKIKEMVNEKPDDFFQKWFENEIGQVIDEEDLGRSELRREVLFYHQVLENALDHLIQAIFAVNHRYFPSRKRTLALIDDFAYKPENCKERLLKMVANGAAEETMMKSIDDLRLMTLEVEKLMRGDKEQNE